MGGQAERVDWYISNQSGTPPHCRCKLLVACVTDKLMWGCAG